jgi:hypothetical protein
VTAVVWNADLVANLIELRGGGLAISGQAANRIAFASSATQLATSANLTYDGNFLLLGSATARGSGNNYIQFQDPTGAKGYVGYVVGDDTYFVYNALNADVRFYTNNLRRASILAGGDWCLGSTSNITDGVGTPTIASGFGSGAAIAGKTYAFKVTCGTGPGSSGTVNFGTTFANAPIVTVSGDASVGAQSQIVPFNVSTTQVSFSNYFDNTTPPINFVVGQIFYVHVRGY